MKRYLVLPVVLAVLGATPLLAQHGNDRQQHGNDRQQHGNQRQQQSNGQNRARANQGHVPAAPAARPRGGAPEVERYQGGRVNSVPHVNHDRWYGHDRPGDSRYQVARPYAHGRFAHVGPSFRYNVVRVDPGLHRFWLPGGFYFEVAPADWPLSADWCWDCGGDDLVVYDDPDHPGWYLVYNVHTGEYVHAQYMGS